MIAVASDDIKHFFRHRSGASQQMFLLLEGVIMYAVPWGRWWHLSAATAGNSKDQHRPWRTTMLRPWLPHLFSPASLVPCSPLHSRSSSKRDYLMYRRYRRSRTVVGCPVGMGRRPMTCSCRLLGRSSRLVQGAMANSTENSALADEKISRGFTRRGLRQRIACYFRCWNTSYII